MKISILKTIAVFPFLMAFSCSKNEKVVHKTVNPDSTTAVQNDTINKDAVIVSKNQEFLDKFKTVKLDTLAFTAPDYGENIGPKLTSQELAMFPKNLKFSTFFHEDYNEFEAVSKFDINSELYGLVARVPGEYSFTSLKLFFYDRKKDQFLQQYFELADKLGDAGYTEEIKSWLWRDGDRLKTFLYRWTKIEKIEPDDPVRESRTDDYFLVQLHPEKFDTLRVSGNNLSKYQHLLNKQTK